MLLKSGDTQVIATRKKSWNAAVGRTTEKKGSKFSMWISIYIFSNSLLGFVVVGLLGLALCTFFWHVRCGYHGLAFVFSSSFSSKLWSTVNLRVHRMS